MPSFPTGVVFTLIILASLSTYSATQHGNESNCGPLEAVERAFELRDPNPPFVDLLNLDPSFNIELPYATPNNFTGKIVYPPGSKAYLRRPAAEALVAVNKELKEKGYQLKIWDAYRPFSIQEKFWKVLSDPRYVAQPVRERGKMVKGSVHNKGGAVDCTLVDLSGKEVEMPTAFDDFSSKAHRDDKSASAKAQSNRLLLQTIMAKYGFVGLPTEWWHFDWKDSAQYELSDTPIEQMGQ